MQPYLGVFVAAMFPLALGQEGEMRQAELIGIPIKAVVYGNSHGALARSPEGRDGAFYIPYYSTTGGALVGYHAESDELTKFRLPSVLSPELILRIRPCFLSLE